MVRPGQPAAAAEAHGGRMVSMVDARNGPEHDRDLIELGWVSSDGEHLNPGGMAEVADALVAAGFEPLPPPDVGR